MLFALTLIWASPSAYALTYNQCYTPKDSTACFISYQKLLSMDNPLTGQQFFNDGRHYVNGQLFMYPTYYIAQTDLDKDGFMEIIVTVPETEDEQKGWFCKEHKICVHYILQDRNTNPKRPSLKNFKVMGPIYAFGIAPSTDEIVDGYKSLRVYKDIYQKKFDVFQYDKKTDNYFNISMPE